MYGKYSDTTSTPAREMFVITASSAPLNPLPKALRADSDGTVTLKAVDSTTPVTISVQAGELILVRASHVTAFTVTALHGLA